MLIYEISVFFSTDLWTWSLLKDNPSHQCPTWTVTQDSDIHRHRQDTPVLLPVKPRVPPTSPVATSMANSTTTAVKVLGAPGPAGRSSPEGSQVSSLSSFKMYFESGAGLGLVAILQIQRNSKKEV